MNRANFDDGEDTFNCLGGALPVTEAGGLANDLSGEPYRCGSTGIIAAPAPVHRSLTALFEVIV
jgi:fructose-1,6-bisphosphatase/inositol monophosphatase family enzyme